MHFLNDKKKLQICALLTLLCLILFDDKTKLFKEGKYTSVNHINQELNLKLNADYVRRIITKYRADPNMRNGENSFLARYGHIQIEKIYEPI